MSDRRSRTIGLRVFLGEARESLFMAMDALRSHKLRSALTLLGILVGVFSIIVVMTAMKAMQKSISNELDFLGGKSFMVQTWPTVNIGNEDNEKFRRRKNITYKQGLQLAGRATLAQAVAVSLGVWAEDLTSKYAKRPPNTSISGETPASFVVNNWVIKEGRAVTDSDLAGARDVCVLGDNLAKVLFPHSSALGEEIKIRSIPYSVIGIIEPQGSMSGGNQDNFVVLPLTTALNRWGGWRWDCDIHVLALDGVSFDDAVEQARGIMRVLRKVPAGAEDDFEISTRDSIMEQIGKFTFAVRIGVIVISSIALVAAGIGIMNIMLVSVTERTREIGIRRAIGAKKRNIMTQFIMEAIILCEIGGLLGVVLGVAGGNLCGHFMNLPVVIPVEAILLGVGICSMVGLAFGTYPAYKAANLDPIESLRYE